MSVFYKLIIISIAYIFLKAPLGPTATLADSSVREALEEKHRAMNRYYQAIRKLSKPDAAREKALRKKILEPAERAYFQAVEAQQQKVLQSLDILPASPQDEAEMQKLAIEQKAAGREAGDARDRPSASEAIAPESGVSPRRGNASGPEKEPEVVKGQFPRLIEFGGKPKGDSDDSKNKRR